MKIKAILAGLTLCAGLIATPAFAAAPFYQVTQNGSSAQITVSGTDANAPVMLYYYPTGGISQAIASAGSIGMTNSSGYFSSTVTGATYSIPGGSSTYVSVDSQMSNLVSWPYLSGTMYGTTSISPSAISMSVGQSSSVTISGGSAAYFVSSNSNPSAVNTTINGSTLNLYGLNTGYATITVCSNGVYSSAGCANAYVSVGGANGTLLQLNQSSVSLSVGQVSVISAVNSSAPSLFVSSNSNPNAVSAVANGNTVSITAIASGSAVISVCNSSGYSSCGVVNVTVGYNYNNPSQNVALAQNSVTVAIGQSQQVAIYGSGSYYVSSNSNPNAATASVIGNSSVVVQGVNPGSTTLSICPNQYAAYSGSCATLYVTVNSNYGYGYGFVPPTYIPPVSQPYYIPGSSYAAPVANGVYLSQVPYTGIADDAKMLAFVSLLVAVSGITAYYIVGKKIFA